MAFNSYSNKKILVEFNCYKVEDEIKEREYWVQLLLIILLKEVYSATSVKSMSFPGYSNHVPCSHSLPKVFWGIWDQASRKSSAKSTLLSQQIIRCYPEYEYSTLYYSKSTMSMKKVFESAHRTSYT